MVRHSDTKLGFSFRQTEKKWSLSIALHCPCILTPAMTQCNSKWLPSLLWHTVKMCCYKTNTTTGQVMALEKMYTKPAASIRPINISCPGAAVLDLLIHAWTINPTDPNGVSKVPLNMNFWQHEFAWTGVQPMGARQQPPSANRIYVLRTSWRNSAVIQVLGLNFLHSVSCPGAWWSNEGIVGKFSEVSI